jgi:hypothetical protein
LYKKFDFILKYNNLEYIAISELVDPKKLNESMRNYIFVQKYYIAKANTPITIKLENF